MIFEVSTSGSGAWSDVVVAKLFPLLRLWSLFELRLCPESCEALGQQRRGSAEGISERNSQSSFVYVDLKKKQNTGFLLFDFMLWSVVELKFKIKRSLNTDFMEMLLPAFLP